MKQAIRAIGWATYILWLVVMVFTVTAVYSAFQLSIAFGEPRTSTSEKTMTLLLPFSVDNKGLYDISDLNITTIVQESNGALISNSSTVVPLISSGNKVDSTHNISISLNKMTSTSLSRLLFYDTDFNVDMNLALRYARVIPLKISTNSTMTWGAPLYNLAIEGVPIIEPYNSTHVRAILPISFENHSSFRLNGNMRVEIWNTKDKQVGAATTSINVPPQKSYHTNVEVLVSVGFGNLKEARLYFNTSVFNYGPVVMPIG